MYYDAILILDDGTMVNGIIEQVDDRNIGILIGQDMQINEDDKDMNRQPNRRYNRYNKYRRYRRRNYPIDRIYGVRPLPYPIYPGYPPYPVYPYPFLGI